MDDGKAQEGHEGTPDRSPERTQQTQASVRKPPTPRRLPPIPTTARKAVTSPVKSPAHKKPTPDVAPSVQPDEVVPALGDDRERSMTSASPVKSMPLGERALPSDNAGVNAQEAKAPRSSRRLSQSPTQSRRAGSQRTRFSVETVPKAADELVASTSTWSSDSGEGMTVKVQPVSSDDSMPSYNAASREDHRDPMLVSVEDHYPAPMICEVVPDVDSDFDMDGRSMTPGPPARSERRDGSTMASLHLEDTAHRSLAFARPEDIEWENLPDTFKRRPGSHRLDIQADWDTTNDSSALVDPEVVPLSRLFGPGAAPSRLIHHEVHPHASAVICGEMEVTVPDTDDDFAQLEASFRLLEELKEAVPSGDDEIWFYCTECCAWSFVRTAGDLASWPDVKGPESLGPLDTTDSEPIAMKAGPLMKHSGAAPGRDGPYSVALDQLDDFKTAVTADIAEHPRSHHFHAFRGLANLSVSHAIISAPQAHSNTLGSFESTEVPAETPADLWSCCQCAFRVQVPALPPAPGCFPADLVHRIRSRQSALGNVQSPDMNLVDTLATLSQ